MTGVQTCALPISAAAANLGAPARTIGGVPVAGSAGADPRLAPAGAAASSRGGRGRQRLTASKNDKVAVPPAHLDEPITPVRETIRVAPPATSTPPYTPAPPTTRAGRLTIDDF